ncbi:hypothetical protein [Piscirickettsia salmonis]|uniref:hypothetical protein n=1 Tax=Piscirickettsia salmonis TaxID=1238 RepID=UPI0006BDE653|nr:hypothetical protein [Piscirickettsia salmonis]ALA26644.1 ATPase AAA [Piscirickettsia salmonis]APS45857.1 hypothetical protein AVI48_15605 [Piscirickettsia salmonis]APS49260.1 hypothetical protein AVI49_16520 [Piscirickettsia salmonis]QGO82353.1 hypothetical protein Psal107_03404 [Piscirickettsia salmonis]QGP24182.1 hypothetical protein Psal158_03356 [Piscirickettsia salmonis]
MKKEIKKLIDLTVDVLGFLSLNYVIALCLTFALAMGFEIYVRAYAVYSSEHAQQVMPFLEHVEKDGPEVLLAVTWFFFAIALAVSFFFFLRAQFFRGRHA